MEINGPLVNVGRFPLAATLGLNVPRDPQDERAMWQAVTAFVRRDYDPPRAARLTAFRAAPTRSGQSQRGLQILLRGDDHDRSLRLELRAHDERLIARSPPYLSRDAALRDLALLRAGASDAEVVDSTVDEP